MSRWITGPTPNRGVFATVSWDRAMQSLVVVEYGHAAFVILRHEWERSGPPGRTSTVRRITLDWDGQVISRRDVPAMPSPPSDRASLAHVIADAAPIA